MHFICDIFRHISLGIDESRMGKFVGIPEIQITTSKQYAGICDKYGNIYRNSIGIESHVEDRYQMKIKGCGSIDISISGPLT